MGPTKPPEPRRIYSRPANTSLQAFKSFIRGLTLALNPDAKDDLREEQWREAWQQFWTGSNNVTSEQE